MLKFHLLIMMMMTTTATNDDYDVVVRVGEVWKLHRKLMSPSLKDSTVFSHLSIFNFYIREFCNTKLDEEAQNRNTFDVMLPLNVALLSMYLDATLGIEWHQKTAYANFFSE